MARGRYIVFEGGEGSGKSTQAALAAEALGAYLTREPGGTVLGENVRALLLDPSLEMGDITEAWLMNSARVELMLEVEVRLEQGQMVISDRSFVSTMAYQGHGRGLNLDYLRAMCQMAVQNTTPDLVIVLTVSEEVASERRRGRGVQDRFELEQAEFHRKVNRGFLEEAELNGYILIDGAGPAEEVAARVQKAIQDKIRLWTELEEEKTYDC